MDRPAMTHLFAAALVVQLLNPSGAPAAVVRQAQEEVTRVYANIDVSVEWSEASVASAERSDIIRIVLLPYETGDLRRRQNEVMGAAMRTEAGNAIAYVYYRRVQAQANRYQVSVGSVLACAIAHELGHLLLPGTAHASTGLMRACWSRDEFNLADQGQLRFLPGDVARIRAGLQ
jgi:hypothetical protein